MLRRIPKIIFVVSPGEGGARLPTSEVWALRSGISPKVRGKKLKLRSEEI